jgi:hypothetical protein
LSSLLFFRLIFAMAFVSSTLWLIEREKQSQLQASLMNEAVARQRAESEIQRRETQERFMTMLMHELKTPLAIIQLAASSLGRQLVNDKGAATRVKNINRSVDDLNALVERCASGKAISAEPASLYSMTPSVGCSGATWMAMARGFSPVLAGIRRRCCVCYGARLISQRCLLRASITSVPMTI